MPNYVYRYAVSLLNILYAKFNYYNFSSSTFRHYYSQNCFDFSPKSFEKRGHFKALIFTKLQWSGQSHTKSKNLPKCTKFLLPTYEGKNPKNPGKVCKYLNWPCLLCLYMYSFTLPYFYIVRRLYSLLLLLL